MRGWDQDQLRPLAFGSPYYRSLLEGRGILFADQQFTGSEETGSWVRAKLEDERAPESSRMKVMKRSSTSRTKMHQKERRSSRKLEEVDC
ncbi:hypothetical protein CRG98_023143 [Punica granatum]|uniref:Uncharacterized protein n=1 Tax=Punica granatum TaxID=22663 RepID=A0A2I0JJQ1_PUNGR|nr:hypothetical protein CRG98_023143 [Punica granatum]